MLLNVLSAIHITPSRRAATNLLSANKPPVPTPSSSQFLFHHKKSLHFAMCPSFYVLAVGI